VTRLIARLFGQNLLDVSRKVPTCVLVALADEDSRAASGGVARRLRDRGIAAQVAPEPAKYGKQIRFADRRGIPYVWFPNPAGDEVRDIRSGEQGPADAGSWQPPADDLRPRLVASSTQP
jgi:histidyl-tRNA synthetase